MASLTLDTFGGEAPGDLDESYGNDGVTAVTVAEEPVWTFDAAMDTDGGIVSVGGTGLPTLSEVFDIVLTRFTKEGHLDPNFGTNGVVRQTNAARTLVGEAVGIQPDGKIVLLAWAWSSGNLGPVRTLVYRYLRNGTLDPSFGTGGVVTIGGDPTTYQSTTLVLQPDGKIVVAGSRFFGDNGWDNFVVRLLGSGAPDPSFGVNGMVSIADSLQVYEATLQQDGKILLGCSTTPYDQSQLCVVRLTSNGQPDSTFGNNGLAVRSIATAFGRCSRIKVLSNGKIVALGDASLSTSGVPFSVDPFAPRIISAVVAQFNSNGAPDTTFGESGLFHEYPADNFFHTFDFAEASNGSLIFGIYAYGSSTPNSTLVKLTPNGTLDTNLGTGGTIECDPYPASVDYSRPGRLFLRPDGKVVLTGYGRYVQEGVTSNSIYAARFHLDPYRSKLTTDMDGDGIIAFDAESPDKTTPTAPFKFWLNLDIDSDGETDTAGEDLEATLDNLAEADSADLRITSRRDLEDFALLNLEIPEPLRSQVMSGCTVTFHLEGTAQVNLAAVGRTDFAHILNSHYAQTLVSLPGMPSLVPMAQLKSGQDAVLTPINLTGSQASVTSRLPFLLEGVRAGTGILTATVRDSAGRVVAISEEFHIDLIDIKAKYDHFTAGDTTQENATVLTTPQVLHQNIERSLDPSTPYILFVHGWRLKPWQRQAFAETAFKRLYWAGYRGAFGLYSWPTEWVDDKFYAVPLDRRNYDRSEFQAWKSAEGLRHLLNTLETGPQSRVILLAHSMGNVTASEALRLGLDAPGALQIKSYIASQAAVAASAYDHAVPSIYDGMEELPDHNRFWGEFNQPFFGRIQSMTTRGICNFVNPQDFALARTSLHPNLTLIFDGTGAWQFNQSTKPDAGYVRDGDKYARRGPGGTLIPLNYAVREDVYRAMAFAAPADSRALGAESETEGEIGATLRLDQAPFSYTNDRNEHSAQFRASIHQRLSYWKALLQASGVQPPPELAASDVTVALRSKYCNESRHVYFLDDVSLPLQFEAEVRPKSPPGQPPLVLPALSWRINGGPWTSGTSTRIIDVGKSLGLGGKVEVCWVDSSGVPTPPVAANFTVIPVPSGIDPALLKVSDKSLLSYEGEIRGLQLLSEAVRDITDISEMAGETLSATLTVDTTVTIDGTGMARTGFLSVDKNSSWKWGRLAEMTWGLKGQLTWRYLRHLGEWDPGGALYLNANTGQLSFTRYRLLWYVPTFVSVDLNASGSIGLQFLGMNGDENDAILGATGRLDAEALVYSGAGGRDIASIGLAGKAKFMTGFAADRSLLGMELATMEVSLNYRREWWLWDTPSDVELVRWNWTSSGSLDRLAADLLSTTGVSADRFTTVIPRTSPVSLSGPSATLTVASASPDPELTLDHAAFKNPAPHMVPHGTSRMLFWLDDATERTAVNRTVLVCQTQNEGTWSAPVRLDDDGTPDFSPQAVTMANGGVMAVWQQTKTLLPDHATLADALPQQEIAALVIAADGQPGQKVLLTDNSFLDARSRLVASPDGSVTVFWIENNANDLHGSLTRPNRILSRTWDGSVWQPASVVASALGLVTEYSAALTPTGMVVHYVLDVDDAYSTALDRELYIIQQESGVWSAPVRMTDNDVEDASPTVIQLPAGALRLLWSQDGIVKESSSLLDLQQATVFLPATSIFLPDLAPIYHGSGLAGLAWPATGSSGKPGLHYILYQPATSTWSSPLHFAGDDAYERHVTGTADLDGTLHLAYAKDTLTVDGAGYPSVLRTDLTSLLIAPAEDLLVQHLKTDAVPPYTSGQGVEITCQVMNRGMTRSESAEISYLCGESLLLPARPVPSLAPGEVYTDTFTWTPAALPQSSVQARLSRAGTPFSTSPAALLFPADLTFGGGAHSPTAGEVTLEVRNDGLSATPQSVQVTCFDARQPTVSIATATLPALAGLTSTEVVIPLPKDSTLEGGSRQLRFVVDPDHLVHEINEENNERSFYTLEPSPEIISTGFAVGFAGSYMVYQVAATHAPTTLTATDLPPGLSWNASQRMIAGVPATPGSYSVKLTAVNEYGTHKKEVTLQIEPRLTDFDLWKGTIYGTHYLSHEYAPLGDGLPLLIKYAFGLDPLLHGGFPLVPDVGLSGLPSIRDAGLPQSPQLLIEFVRRKASALDYTPEFSQDLKNWTTPASSTWQIQSLDDEWERVKVLDPTTGQPTRFGRVRVSVP